PGAPDSFGPEHLWNYELGTKTQLLDDKLIVNGAVYFIDWEDVIVDAYPGNPLFSFSVNAGTAHSKGVELEVTAIPVSGLELSAAVNYTDAKIVSLSPFAYLLNASVDAKLPFVPEYTLYGSAQYTFPVLDGGWLARLRADVNYVAHSFSAIDNLPSTINHP